MLLENSEMNGRGGKPPPNPGPNCQPRPEPEPEIDLERLVWDPEYRERMRRRWNRLG